ncbi:MAG: helix-turn-helix domain-containing protein [Sedimenticola sp.]
MPTNRSTVKAGYSIPEVMDAMGVCRQTVYNEINAGRLKSFKIGKRRLVSPRALGEWVNRLERACA